MIKLTDILSEIKINNPGNYFRFTDKFKKDYKEYLHFLELADKFISDIDIWDSEDDLFLDMKNTEYAYDVRALDIENSNNVEEVIKNLINKDLWEDEEAIKEYFFTPLLQRGYITKIKL